MSNHGVEANLPITPLAQWMRDTTGRMDDGGRPSGLNVREVYILDRHVVPAPTAEGEPFWPPPLDRPGTLTVDDVLRIAEVDELRLERASHEAIAAFTAEGHSYDEIKEHERRIWALHDQILREATP
jgi:hypothetical protein